MARLFIGILRRRRIEIKEIVCRLGAGTAVPTHALRLRSSNLFISPASVRVSSIINPFPLTRVDRHPAVTLARSMELLVDPVNDR